MIIANMSLLSSLVIGSGIFYKLGRIEEQLAQHSKELLDCIKRNYNYGK